MAAKLKSLLRQIHWSLVLRSAIFALAWFLFPFWLFFLIALYLYFTPIFQSQKLSIPFFVLVLLTYIEPQNILFLLVFVVLFYYLLLIKDLLLIDRKSAYEFIIFVMAFFLIRSFYEHLGTGIITGTSLWYGFLVAAVVGLLVDGFLRVFPTATQREGFELDASRHVAAWLTFLLIWQFLILGLFLPLDFVYQSVIIFVIAVLVIDFIPEYYFGGISRQKLLIAGTALFALLVVVLTSVQWSL